MSDLHTISYVHVCTHCVTWVLYETKNRSCIMWVTWSEWLVATGFKHFREKVKVQRPFVQTVNFAKAELLWSVGVSSGILNQDEASDLRRIMENTWEYYFHGALPKKILVWQKHLQLSHTSPIPCTAAMCWASPGSFLCLASISPVEALICRIGLILHQRLWDAVCKEMRCKSFQ